MPKAKRFKTRITKKAKSTARALIKGADGMPVTEISTYGTEPMPVSGKDKPVSMQDALNWYSRFKTIKDASKYFIDFAKQYGYTKEEIAFMRKCPDHFTSSSYAWLAKMLLNGIKLDEKYENRLIAKIRERINHGKYLDELNKAIEAETEPTVKRNIHEVMREAVNDKASTIMGQIDGWIDDFCDANMTGEYDLFSYLESIDAKPAHVAIVEDRLGVWLAEFISARDGLEPDFVEGYSHLTRPQLKKLIKWVEDLKSQSANFVSVKKSQRGPRKGGGARKQVDPVKMTSRLETVSVCGINSLDKTKIIGANELWVVDQWGGIRMFKSETSTGFSMSGRKLKNITEAECYRHPQRSKVDKENFSALIKGGFPKKSRKRKEIFTPIFKTDKVDEISPSIAKTLIWHIA